MHVFLVYIGFYARSPLQITLQYLEYLLVNPSSVSLPPHTLPQHHIPLLTPAFPAPLRPYLYYTLLIFPIHQTWASNLYFWPPHINLSLFSAPLYAYLLTTLLDCKELLNHSQRAPGIHSKHFFHSFILKLHVPYSRAYKGTTDYKGIFSVTIRMGLVLSARYYMENQEGIIEIRTEWCWKGRG